MGWPLFATVLECHVILNMLYCIHLIRNIHFFNSSKNKGTTVLYWSPVTLCAHRIKSSYCWKLAVLEPSGCSGVYTFVLDVCHMGVAAGLPVVVTILFYFQINFLCPCFPCLWWLYVTAASGWVSSQQPIKLSDKCWPNLHTWGDE